MANGKGKKTRRDRRQTIVVNGPVTIQTLNNFGRNPTVRPTGTDRIERADDGFAANSGAVVEDATDLGEIEDDTGYGQACKASNDICAEWVHAPCVVFRRTGAWFNHAAIQAYGMSYGMQIIPTVPHDKRAVRFYLGAENFPNPNARNKTGHFTLSVNHACDTAYAMQNKGCVHPHPDRVSKNGKPYPNQEWLLGAIIGRKRKDVPFPLTDAIPELIGMMGRLCLDKRYCRTVAPTKGKADKRYYVLYTRFAELKPIPEDMASKMRFRFRDYLDRKERDLIASM